MSDDLPLIKTAGIIIIGNEILSGKVQDSNSFYLVTELRALGVYVKRISVIPDDMDVIGQEAVLFSKSFDYVFTSGGIGPTHDDITMAAIAKGFDVKRMRHPGLESRFRMRYGHAVNEAVLTMADVPEGAEIIDLGNEKFPLIAFKNVFIFPGIPKYLTEKFSLIKERFRSSRIYLKQFFLDIEETNIAIALTRIVSENQEVTFGSYPILDNPGYKTIITLESGSGKALDKAAAQLLKELPENVITRAE